MFKLMALLQTYMAAVEREEGQTQVEYILILALIAVVLIGTWQALAGGLDTTLQSVIGAL